MTELHAEIYTLLQGIYRTARESRLNEEDNIRPIAKDGTPIRKLFVGNLAERTTYKDLVKLFSKYGPVESCYLKRNPGRSNFAFVTFGDVTDAIKAREDGIKMEIHLHNRNLRVMSAHPWHQPESTLFNEDIIQDYVHNDCTNTQIHMLNDDCLAHIFLYLPITDKFRLERVCKRWRAVSRQAWRFVKVLNVDPFTWGFARGKQIDIDTAILRKVLLRCGRFLNKIRLAEVWDDSGPSTLSIIGKLCPNLHTLDMFGFNVSPSSISSLAANCHTITHLSIGNLQSTLLDLDLAKLFQVNSQLRYLQLNKVDIRGEGLIHLPWETMEELILVSCHNLYGNKLSKGLVHLTNLKSLIFENCSIYHSRDVIEAIGKYCKKLKSLAFCMSRQWVTPQDLITISELPELEVLKAYHTGTIPDEVLVKLSSSCRQLKHVNLSSCDFESNAGIAAIANLTNLEILKLNYTLWPSEPLADYIMPNSFHQLKQLECQNCRFLRDEDVYHILVCSRQLELLDLSRCKQITNKTLHGAVAVTSLRKSTVLKIVIGGIPRLTAPFVHASPFLQIINVDFTILRIPLNHIPDALKL